MLLSHHTSKQPTVRALMVVENCPYERDPRAQREAKALSAAGHVVSIICQAEKGRPWFEIIDGLSVYRFGSWRSKGGKLSYLLEYTLSGMAITFLSLFVLISKGFDVIHLANPPDLMVPGAAIYKLIGKQIIYDQHDLCPELYVAKFPNPKTSIFRFLLRMEALSIRLADHIITPNDSYKKTDMARNAVVESKITVVRSGPDLPRCKDVDVQLRGISKNILAYAGMIGFQDGVDLLCSILHKVRYSLGRENFYCVVIGTGDALQKIRNLTVELRLEDKVRFTGWINDFGKYHCLLNAADICISPEPYNPYNDQSTFLKVMDFMAIGKPIVAFDLAETRFTAGESAVYARPNDLEDFAHSLVKLMDNPALRKEMGQCGRRLIREKLAWKHSVPKLLCLYDKCANRKLRGGHALLSRLRCMGAWSFILPQRKCKQIVRMECFH